MSQNGLHAPVYSYEGEGTSWGCTIALEDGYSGVWRTFVAQGPHASKKDAKKAAARFAVEFMVSQA